MEPTGAKLKVLNAVTTGTSAAVAVRGQGREVSCYIYGSGTIAGGAVQFEEAHDEAYTGTWAAIGTPQTVVDATVKVVHSTGCVGAVRARVSTNITGGGTVSVDIVLN